MKKSEIILSILAVIALGLNLMLVDGTAAALTLILVMLSWLYLVFGFALLNNIKFRNIFKKESYIGRSALRMVSAIFIGFSLSIAVIAVLFGLMTWSGAKIMQLTGLCTLVCCSIPLLIKYIINRSGFYKNVLPRILIWGILCLFLYLLPQTKLLEFKYRNYPAYIQAAKNSMANPNNEQLKLEMEKERMKMRAERHH